MNRTKDVVPVNPLSNSLSNGNDPQTPYSQMVKLSQKRLLQVNSFALSDQVMAEFWITMISLYGKKWVDQYGDFINPANKKISEIVMVWAEALADVDILRIERALRNCLSRESPFPPTLPEFKAMCARKPWE